MQLFMQSFLDQMAKNFFFFYYPSVITINSKLEIKVQLKIVRKHNALQLLVLLVISFSFLFIFSVLL